MNWLAEKPNISVSDIVRRFSVSEVTARHDLISLESEGKLRRVRGGAVSLSRSNAISYPEERINVQVEAKEAIAALHRAGVDKTVMLTGDTKRVAEAVAAELGVDEVRSDLLPADKVSKVEELLTCQHGKAKLAFVGDGINDAPVLSRADIGIAMGAMGSDAAIEAADIVLMDDEPLQIAKAIKISRKCIGIVYQNIVFALVIKFACLALVAIGVADMWAAIFADVGVMVLAVLNAIRALRVHDL